MEIRSDDYQEIMEKYPSRVIRLGTTVLSVLFAFILIGMFLFKYPDIIHAPFMLTANKPSIEIRAKTSGKIIMVNVVDNQKTNRGDVLAVIENSCSYFDYMKLKSELNKWNLSRQKLQSLVEDFDPDCTFELGELQTYFSDFSVVVTEYQNFIASNDYREKEISYQNRIHSYKQYLQNLEEQNKLLKRDLDYSYKQLRRDSIIYVNDYQPESYYEKSKSAVILKNKVIKEAVNEMTLTGIQINETEALIRENDREYRNEKNRIESELKRYLDVLKAQMTEWEQRYLLVSPVDGRIAFAGFRNENQFVSEGDIVFQIVHENTGQPEIIAEVPALGAGKIRTGQIVHMDFDDFPQQQYGKVKGIVESVSTIQNNGMYTLKISLPDSLTTNYGLTLPFKYNMRGRADIITDEIPLAARLINPIRVLFYEGF
jgi:HlyD family secretion protein